MQANHAGEAVPEKNFTSIPVIDISGLFSDPGNNGVHGRNEQIGAKALFDSKQFLYRLVKSLAGTPASERK